MNKTSKDQAKKKKNKSEECIFRITFFDFGLLVVVHKIIWYAQCFMASNKYTLWKGIYRGKKQRHDFKLKKNKKIRRHINYHHNQLTSLTLGACSILICLSLFLLSSAHFRFDTIFFYQRKGNQILKQNIWNEHKTHSFECILDISVH